MVGRPGAATAIPRRFRRSYHPWQEGVLRMAVDRPTTPSAVRAAAGAVGRAAVGQ